MAELPYSGTTLIFMFILQISISYGFIGFYTLGLSYLDDNAIEHNSPALLGKLYKDLTRNLDPKIITSFIISRCCFGQQILGISMGPRIIFVC